MYKIPPTAVWWDWGREKVSKFAVAKGWQCQDTANPFKETLKIELMQKSREKFQDLQLGFGYCSKFCWFKSYSHLYSKHCFSLRLRSQVCWF